MRGFRAGFGLVTFAESTICALLEAVKLMWMRFAI